MPVFSSMTVRRSRTGNGSRDIKVKSDILKNDTSRNLLNSLSFAVRRITESEDRSVFQNTAYDDYYWQQRDNVFVRQRNTQGLVTKSYITNNRNFIESISSLLSSNAIIMLYSVLFTIGRTIRRTLSLARCVLGTTTNGWTEFNFSPIDHQSSKFASTQSDLLKFFVGRPLSRPVCSRPKAVSPTRQRASSPTYFTRRTHKHVRRARSNVTKYIITNQKNISTLRETHHRQVYHACYA